MLRRATHPKKTEKIKIPNVTSEDKDRTHPAQHKSSTCHEDECHNPLDFLKLIRFIIRQLSFEKPTKCWACQVSQKMVLPHPGHHGRRFCYSSAWFLVTVPSNQPLLQFAKEVTVTPGPEVSVPFRSLSGGSFPARAQGP